MKHMRFGTRLRMCPRQILPIFPARCFARLAAENMRKRIISAADADKRDKKKRLRKEPFFMRLSENLSGCYGAKTVGVDAVPSVGVEKSVAIRVGF